MNKVKAGRTPVRKLITIATYLYPGEAKQVAVMAAELGITKSEYIALALRHMASVHVREAQTWVTNGTVGDRE